VRVAALGIALAFFVVAFGGCMDDERGPSAEELAHMVTPSRGAISGTVLDRTNKTMNELNVKLFMTNSNDLAGEVLTDFQGKFYFQRLFPTQYRITVNLKDWTDCTVNVFAGKFTNLTITQPVYPQKPKSC
jgi:hypothetical protein